MSTYWTSGIGHRLVEGRFVERERRKQAKFSLDHSYVYLRRTSDTEHRHIHTHFLHCLFEEQLFPACSHVVVSRRCRCEKNKVSGSNRLVLKNMYSAHVSCCVARFSATCGQAFCHLLSTAQYVGILSASDFDVFQQFAIKNFKVRHARSVQSPIHHFNEIPNYNYITIATVSTTT